MTDRPWYQWYPQDIRGEKTYRLCSPMARLLWRECLDLMHEAPQRGSLVDDQGKPLTPREVATLTALPLGAVVKALDELRTRNVCGWDEERGVMFSRRMVRDTERQRRNADNGRHGGNPKLAKSDNRNREKSDNRNCDESDKANARTRDRVPESRDQKPDPETRESVRARAPVTGSGVMAGMLPRDHLRHAFCGRVCLPDRLYDEFLRAIGGDPETVHERMDAFCEAVEASWGNGGPQSATAIGDDAFVFWRARWAEHHGSTVKTAADKKREREDAIWAQS